MNGVTTAPAVKAALFTLFQGAVEPPTEVWRNRTNSEHQVEENVYIGDVTNGNRDWRNVGRPAPHQVEENYTIQVNVCVQRYGTDAEGTEARMWAIVLPLEAAMAANPTLGNLENLQWILVDSFSQSSTAGTDGWSCEALLRVAVKARI
jgi:hypothetical protein